nr:O-antigen ligase family protein [Cohnella zeiphila]
MPLAYFACAGGLVLTESRTAFLFLLIVLGVLGFWNRKVSRFSWFQLAAGTSLGIIAALTYQLSPWLPVPFAAAAVWLSVRTRDTAATRRAYAPALIASVPLTLAVAFMSNSGLAARWSSFLSKTGEGYARLVYAHDAWSMIRKSPIWGYGAGGWTNFQYRYQTADYYTEYVHNHLLQLMTEVGGIGLLLYVAAFAFLIAEAVRKARLAEGDAAFAIRCRLLACFTLFFHSLTDFTFSYPYLLGLAFVLATVPSGSGAISPQEKIPVRKIAFTAIAAITVAVATLLLLSSAYEGAVDKALASGRSADAIHWLDRSARIALFADRIHDRKARLYYKAFLSSRDRRYLQVAETENEKSLTAAPQNIWYLKLKSDILWELGDRDTSVSLLSRLAGQNRFIQQWQADLQSRSQVG